MQKYMEAAVMSEAVMSKIVVASDFDETVTEVLAQIVCDGDEVESGIVSTHDVVTVKSVTRETPESSRV